MSESDPAAIGAVTVLGASAGDPAEGDLDQPGRGSRLLRDSRMAGLTTVAAVVVLLLLTRGVHDVAQATVAGLVT
ncbi:MAG TPA: hypothetical protein VIO57_08520, partial [Chloroflexota bacterium]